MTLNKKLLLVTGCPRSGTTIANIVLNSHPNISITNECNLIDISEKFEKSSIFSRFRSINSKDLTREMSLRESYKINDLKRFVPSFDSSIDSLLFSFCSSIKNNSNENKIFIFGDKYPRLYGQNLLRFKSKIRSEIFILNLTRKPSEVVNSILRRAKNAELGNDYWSSIKTIDRALEEWIIAQNWSRKIIKDFKILNVNYNALINDPKSFALVLSKFLDVPNLFNTEQINNNYVPSILTKKDLKLINKKLGDIDKNWENLPLLLNECELGLNLDSTKITFRDNYLIKIKNNFMKKIFKKVIKKFKKLFYRNKLYPLTKSDLLRKVFQFSVNECIVGDYYEFGTYRGQTLISAYVNLNEIANKRIKKSAEIGINQEANNKRMLMLSNMNFHAFDSFEGLPKLSKEDKYSEDFEEGQFKSDINQLISLANAYKMPSDRLKIHKGWFKETCDLSFHKNKPLQKASIIWLDCDLYSSAKECFKLINHIIQDGTIIIIDDWFSHKGSPIHGVQKAFNDWRNNEKLSNEYSFTEFNKEGWKRNSFIINKINT